LTSIRPNFIEHLKKGLDMDETEEEEEEQQQQQPEQEIITQVNDYFEIIIEVFLFSFLVSIINW
jgi:hypothetical protein